MFAKSKEDSPFQPMNQNSKPERRNDANTAPSIISSDVTIDGNINTVGEVQLDGIVEGDIICGSLVLGEHGEVKGMIKADTVTIRGKIEGGIKARLVRLEKSARVTGDVIHETLSVEAGAVIDGKFSHTEASATKPSPVKSSTPAEKVQTASLNG